MTQTRDGGRVPSIFLHRWSLCAALLCCRALLNPLHRQKHSYPHNNPNAPGVCLPIFCILFALVLVLRCPRYWRWTPFSHLSLGRAFLANTDPYNGDADDNDVVRFLA
ncbi:hypothetical protein BGW36DRAFT_189420 [Talaromyces proteolyticus]|uniref:Uncharacterized protein n=1 Tax=Talaromyces proteolyticus TaxID=1131652 RepID=A0AAD4Q079_9EURO|nr:uncharacterized protein BGW36DRAFT_189420 [Talaromyces proteolyticus]KAH8696638.1 hypothetical protein BGW36DRAFT_189420 [Talaromyces proteolyticus]